MSTFILFFFFLIGKTLKRGFSGVIVYKRSGNNHGRVKIILLK